MLYHGSKSYISKFIEPRISYGGHKLVYATDLFTYALVRAGNFDITKFLVREDWVGEKYRLAELVPGAFEQLFNRPGYVYIVEPDCFVPSIDQHEFISSVPVRVVKRINIENVWGEMQKHKDAYELIPFDDSTDYWSTVKGGLEGYLKRKNQRLHELRK